MRLLFTTATSSGRDLVPERAKPELSHPRAGILCRRLHTGFREDPSSRQFVNRGNLPLAL